jgi:hypothetical protein
VGIPSPQKTLGLIKMAIVRRCDAIRRRRMMSGIYILAGSLLIISAFLFKAGTLNATTQAISWVVIFFVASSGASAANLTVSEIFPVEVRAKAIAVFSTIARRSVPSDRGEIWENPGSGPRKSTPGGIRAREDAKRLLLP